jgi:hypothetical protein
MERSCASSRRHELDASSFGVLRSRFSVRVSAYARSTPREGGQFDVRSALAAQVRRKPLQRCPNRTLNPEPNSEPNPEPNPENEPYELNRNGEQRTLNSER